MSAKLNKYRLRNIINDMRLEMSRILYRTLEGYAFKINATTDHIADRILDRTTHHTKAINTVNEILISMCEFHACNILHYAQKSFNEGKMQNVVVYRKVNHKIFAIPITIQMFEDEFKDRLINITIRTMHPEYDAPVLAKNQTIHVNYMRPKIEFEYDGFRRVMSRLDKLVVSDDCPEALKVLR